MTTTMTETQMILGMTRAEFLHELNARDHRKYELRMSAADTDKLWAAAPRIIPAAAPIVKASEILRDYGYIKPFGNLPVPEFLWPCWLVREKSRHWRPLYLLFAWCDECQRWDRYGAQDEWSADIIAGGTLDARCPHHRGHPGDIFNRFFGFYNFGAAPNEIQAIYKKTRTTLKGWHTPPPEHLRRIKVVNDIEAA